MKKIILLFFLISWALARPTIGNFYFDGVVPWGSDAISPKALISVSVTTPGGSTLNYNLFQLFIDNEQVSTLNPWNYSYDVSNKLFKYKITRELSTGRHEFKLVANDGERVESLPTYAFVASSQLKIMGSLVAYPSPASLNIHIGYELTDTEDTEIYIYNINGMIVYKEVLGAGSTGARAGYNAWPYDLQDSAGNELSNGIYVVIVTAKVNGEKKILGKTKFIVLR